MKQLRVHLTEKTQLLKRCQLFREISPAAIETLAGIASIQKYERDELVFVTNEEALGLFFILNGQVKIYRSSSDGREQILHLFSAGDFFGEVPMFQGGFYPANACTLNTTEILFLPRKAFLNECRNQPEILFTMLATLCSRLRHFVNLVDDLSLKDIRTRLAHFLLTGSENNSLQLKFSKKVLASRLGTTPETLSRCLNQLQEEKIIEVQGRTISIQNKTTLENLVLPTD